MAQHRLRRLRMRILSRRKANLNWPKAGSRAPSPCRVGKPSSPRKIAEVPSARRVGKGASLCRTGKVPGPPTTVWAHRLLVLQELELNPAAACRTTQCNPPRNAEHLGAGPWLLLLCGVGPSKRVSISDWCPPQVQSVKSSTTT